MSFLKWLDNNLEETLMMIMLAVLTTVMGVSVITRYLMNNALSWAEEICRYLFIWSAFLSASLCLKKRSSIKIDMLMTALSRPMQRIMLIVGDFFMLAFFCYMLYGGWNVTMMMYTRNQTSPALLLPMWIVYGASVVGFSLAIVRILQRLRHLILTPGAHYETHIAAGNAGIIEREG